MINDLPVQIIKMIEDIASVKSNIEDIKDDLAHHIHRTEINEQAIEVLKKHMWMSTGGVAAVGFLLTLITLLSKMGII
jgi:ElaB/YqjD/DUF883 family membrane-anchored ribosome-binding protein